MMLWRAFLAALLFLPALLLAQDQTWSVESIIISPQKYYIGDKIEIRTTFMVDESVSVNYPDLMPELAWGKIDTITIRRNPVKTEVVITLYSYSPGRQLFPAMELGSVQIPQVPLLIASLLDGEELKLPSMYPFYWPSWYNYTFLTSMGFALLIGIIVFFISRSKKSFVKSFAYLIRSIIQKRLFSKELTLLEQQLALLSCKSFFTQLSGSVRVYLEQRYGMPFRSQTTAEINALMAGISNDESLCKQMSSVLEMSDQVKFAGHEIPLDARKQYLAIVKKIFYKLDRREKKRAAV